MRMKMMYFIVVLFIVLPSTSFAVQVCELRVNSNSFMELTCSNRPLYYVLLNDAPNWCEYNTGDNVYVKLDTSIIHSSPTQWYVIPKSTTGAVTLPLGFYPSAFFVFGPIKGRVVGNPGAVCGLSPF